MSKPRKPSVFIGSSTENLKLASAVQENLERDSEPTVWTQGIFQPSKTNLESLLGAIGKFEFAIMILSPNDISQIRGQIHQIARDNVVFELGLFIGRLGKERTFIIIPREIESLHLPTDLIGITPVTYDAGRTDKNWNAALGPACNQIIRVIELIGSNPPLHTSDQNVVLTDDEHIAIIHDWFQKLSIEERGQVIYYEKIDKLLNLPIGTGQRFIIQVARNFNREVERKGPSLVLFKYVAPPIPRDRSDMGII